MNNKVITIKNLNKNFSLGKFDFKNFIDDKINKKKKNKVALKEINLNIIKGEKVGLIGDNGAGKSTLLKIISRITYPSAGYIKVIGRVSSILEVGVGFHPELNGIENIYLLGAIQGMKRNEIQNHFDNIINFSELTISELNTPIKRYSTGMVIKLGVAIAIYLESEIVILDEILAVVDKNFKEKAYNAILKKIREKNKTLIFVSHQLDSVERLCERAILIKNGSIVSDGNTKEVIKIYNDFY